MDSLALLMLVSLFIHSKCNEYPFIRLIELAHSIDKRKKGIGNAQHFRWMRQVAKKGRVMSKRGVCTQNVSKDFIVCSIIASCALEETPDTLRHRLLIF